MTMATRRSSIFRRVFARGIGPYARTRVTLALSIPYRDRDGNYRCICTITGRGIAESPKTLFGADAIQAFLGAAMIAGVVLRRYVHPDEMPDLVELAPPLPAEVIRAARRASRRSPRGRGKRTRSRSAS